MSAGEEIQAAIDKLAELRDNSTLAPWSVDEQPETGECRIIREFEFFGSQIEPVTNGGSQRADADLIVTLNHTIDAQLAILRHTGKFYSGDLGIGANRHVVELARAINGGTQ